MSHPPELSAPKRNLPMRRVKPRRQPKTPKQRPKRMGRPKGSHTRTKDLEDDLFDYLSENFGTLRQWSQRSGVPVRTVYGWAEDDADFRARLARARANQRQTLLDETLETADDETVAPDRAELKIETRFKYLAVIDPNSYGKRVAVTGAKDAPPVVPALTELDAAAQIAGILAAAEERLRERGEV